VTYAVVECGMKLDGRHARPRDARTNSADAMKRVREGEDPATVIASYGFCRTTIYKWMKIGRGARTRSECLALDARNRAPA